MNKNNSYYLVNKVEDNPREFVDFLRLSQKHWNQSHVAPNKSAFELKDKWIFRGNSNADWRLVPSAWRNNKIIESQIKNKKELLIKSGVKLENLPSYEDLYIEVENDIMRRFRDSLHDFGYPVEWANKHSIQKTCNFFDFLDIACIAQHHGIPTRLLDWTVNPITAAYFACEPSGRCKKAKKICVWALNIGSQMFREEYGNIKIHEQPRNRNDYLRAQQALFTECSDGVEIHRKTGKWISIEEKVNQYIKTNKNTLKDQKILVKITLNKKHADEVVDILRKEGVSKSSIMPSLDNLASDTLNNWELDKKF